jgi:hypothetical protein
MGKSVSTVSYWKFKQDTGLEPSSIPTRSKEFSSCMSKLFGPGYPIVEISIAKELKEEFEMQKVHTSNFNELVATIRNDALKRSL